MADLIDKQALDALLAQVKGDGLRLTGPGGFLSELVRAVLKRGLQAELTEHLGYARRDAAGNGSGNSRNGSTAKTVQTEIGPVDVRVPPGPGGHVHPDAGAEERPPSSSLWYSWPTVVDRYSSQLTRAAVGSPASTTSW